MTAIGPRDILPEERLNAALVWFLALLVVFGGLASWAVIKLGTTYSWTMALMWTPALAALLTCKILNINLGMLGWKWGQSRWHVMAYLTPILYLMLASAALLLIGCADFDPAKFLKKSADWMGLSAWSASATMTLSVTWLMVFAVIAAMSRTLGEEMGWRGFLTPLLARKFSFPVAALLTGLIWSLWHYPILIYGNYIGEYGYGVPTLISVINYTIMTTALSFPLAYLRLRSGSLWPAVLFHAVHNIVFATIMYRVLVPAGVPKLYLSEFGYAIPAVAVLTALYFWRRAVREGLHGPLNA